MHGVHSGRDLSYFETDVGSMHGVDKALHGYDRAMHGIAPTRLHGAIISKRQLKRVCLSDMARVRDGSYRCVWFSYQASDVEEISAMNLEDFTRQVQSAPLVWL